MKKTILIVLCCALLFSLPSCGKAALSAEELSGLVSEAVLSDNAGKYYEGECVAEGHKVLGSRVNGDILKVYALTMFGYYSFRNDKFIKTAGSGVIPAVLTFEKNGGDYSLLKIDYPADGSEYVKSIKRLFPLKYRSAALFPGAEVSEELTAQERSFAEAYLESIGRDVGIGDYADIDTVLLTDLGVSVEVSNKLIADGRLGEYPYWVGSSEFVEEGKRFVREVSYEEAQNRIVYKTFEKESGDVTEQFVFDAATGNVIEADSFPKLD